MKFLLLLLIFLIFIVIFAGCETGYVKKNGTWVWVTIDENYGKRNHAIVGVDQGTFKVLKNKNYASDHMNVFFRGKKVNYADPKTFECLTFDDYSYAKDAGHVYFRDAIIPGAEPSSFTTMQFPYSKDRKDVYCGNIPLRLSPEDVNTFKVTNEDKMMAGSISTMKLEHFLKYNPDYSWLAEMKDTMEMVITGESGTAVSQSKKFKGYKEVK
ncbi:MAG TPA: DKNYY domain-containing protein [Saprospiraceae bacterium]|jgi:hypothetical protein|nr:DKNYY domain-containing protein [Candidatus Parvibacillus calidus]MBX2938377.1 DKNYY domain-containing protein [Saprospiraceae bacterium]MBX7178540.1 DKNYY domain-containing protein [Saprospiraceae bacterium]MCB0592247.1 DKNYY domain-containing protein [Saprospiraceae bacterium]MCC7148747.1 DKNYY domain-containing protein [Saprospiraceae bacterium]